MVLRANALNEVEQIRFEYGPYLISVQAERRLTAVFEQMP
jgi:hypothetical protein